MAASIRQCEQCGHIKTTSFVTFKANVSLLFRRKERELSGHLCFSCMTRVFMSFQLATLLGTWWGFIGFLLGPLFILQNFVEYISGGLNIAIARGREE
jgi:hypothetical protein